MSLAHLRLCNTAIALIIPEKEKQKQIRRNKAKQKRDQEDQKKETKMFEQKNYTKFSWVSRKASNEGRSAKATFTARERF